MAIVHVQGQIQWIATRTPSGNWVGVCAPMGLSMEAETLDELHSVINETINLLLLDLLEDNELDSYLKERGWQAANIAEIRDMRDVKFDVPWQLIAEGARDSQRRAC